MLRRLPVAPGQVTTLVPPEDVQEDSAQKEEAVLVHCYYRDRDLYLVSPIYDDDPVEEEEDLQPLVSRRRSSVISVDCAAVVSSSYELVPPKRLRTAPSAKFYPVLETLMVRAERAAAATRDLLCQQSTKRLLDSTGKVIQEKANQLSETALSEQPGSHDWDDMVASSVSSVKERAPEIERTMKEVLTMVKDEELHVLLERCKERLEKLVQAELPAATKKALEKTGIHVQTEEEDGGASSFVQSRKAALSALEQLLQQQKADLSAVDKEDFDKLRAELSNNFTVAFDSLASAAKSDRGLSILFESLAEKTTAWQEATGRLLQTRSASLFLEGASRLQARATAIFKQGNLQWAGEIGSQLTKSFTEGDAALARLKSIELGEAVKSRLVEAIEVRSESLGGLDGIIAGALSTVQSKGGTAPGKIQDLLTNLQRTASSSTMDAHETLISVLSSQSRYRDQCLLGIEQALCDLGKHMDLSPQDIAAVARGEGGTAKIFEPIAKRAMQQIQKQLDAAESQVKDATVLGVLSRIRKIMSGELGLSAVMDELVSILNDEKVVEAGETIVQHSERVLDAIEGVSANRAVADAIKIAEKAGISKDSVMREFEKLDVNELVGVAGDAVTDEKARRRLLSSATDTALDFVLRILPSMPVPPFEGAKDGLLYHISNLSM
jgi:hypothetical protein